MKSICIEVELALGDVARVVRDGVRHVVAGHRRHRENRYRARAVEVYRLLVACGELGVEVARIAAVRGNLLHRDRDFLHRVGERRHVGEKNENILALKRELLGDRERDIGDENALDRRVCRRVDEHDSLRKRARLVERRAELEVLVVLEPHAADDDYVRVCLQRDAGEKFVVGFAGLCENRELLRDDERVEEVDHRDVRLHHAVRHDALRRVDRRLPDGRGVLVDRRASVARNGGAGERAAEKRLGEGHLHRLAEEADSCGGVDASRACEDLQRHVRAVELDDLRERSSRARLDFGNLVVLHTLRAERRNGARQRVDLMVDFVVEHWNSLSCPLIIPYFPANAECMKLCPTPLMVGVVRMGGKMINVLTMHFRALIFLLATAPVAQAAPVDAAPVPPRTGSRTATGRRVRTTSCAATRCCSPNGALRHQRSRLRMRCISPPRARNPRAISTGARTAASTRSCSSIGSSSATS